MKSIAIISTIICFALIHVEATEICKWTSFVHVVCRKDDIIVSVQQFHANLELINARGIVNNAFKDLDLDRLIIKQNYTNTSYSMENGVIRPSPPIFLDSLSFNGLPNLICLTVYDTELIYKADQLIHLEKLLMVQLINNELTEVPSDLLEGAPNLGSVHIQYNQIPIVRTNAFAALKNLMHLELVRNNIVSLEPNCFGGLEKLVKLDLSYNNLTLTPNVFSGLKTLMYLYLYQAARPSGISAQAFRGLPSLTRLYLNLKGNLTLEPGMFDDNPKLEVINIAFGDINHVPKNVFNSLKSLNELTFSHCGIESIEPGAFSGLNLRKLYIRSYNYTGRTIQTGTFSKVNATVLSLQQNGIQQLAPRAFDGLKAQLLNLNSNLIKRLVANTFAGAQIKEVNLSYNKIQWIEEDAFKDAKIGSLIVDSSSIIIGNKSKWGIPKSIKIEVVD